MVAPTRTPTADASDRSDSRPGSAPQSSPRGDLVDTVVSGFGLYYLSSLIVLLGVVFGVDLVRLCTDHPDSTAIVPATFAARFAPWDGVWFRRIATEGYSYNPDRMSNVAFYPLYPLSAAGIARVTGLHIDWAMLLTAHLYLIGAFLLMAAYLKGRTPALTTATRDCVLLAMGLFPTTLYFRMSYTESAFLFCMLLAMLGMQRRWPNTIIAAAVGLATAARPVGVALLLPFAWYLWRQEFPSSRQPSAVDEVTPESLVPEERPRGSLFRLMLRGLILGPVCCWGLLGYMAWQWRHLDEPLAFVKTQQHWYERQPPVERLKYALSLATLEPMRSVYDPDCSCYWRNDPPENNPLLNLQFMNPVLVLLTWGAIAWGAFRRIITPRELLLSLGLLGIPYLIHAYRACMSSEARYAAVVFPFYIVLGTALARCPDAIRTMLYSGSAVLLGLYSALFVSWYWFY
ncbi:hypothetical protein Mal4_38360 [Maioricimonas rarisocia]|uniref:Mannosyltransferase (PIG-V) n=1 Tax=Maioricimonas rarisocia TaxID=2528026 RepID=A0A517ZAN7_9PLAN|nr:hypothetical protein [Maioricimonas rarisocia]QDU39491.1 hypothetical protein Mal4_38360 [Maioricimonas rarisocia]